MTSRTLSELALLCGAQLDGDGERRVSGLASLADAGPDQISFLSQSRYKGQLETTRAAAVVVGEGVETGRTDLVLLRCDNPDRAFSAINLAFAPTTPRPEPGVHPTAVVASSAEVADEASVGPLCVVGADAIVAAGVVLHPRVTVGPCATVGEDTVLHSGVVLYAHVRIGARCIVHAGAVIGADGFGFEPTPEGWQKTPQGGIVVVADDVEVGANTTIDCARFGATRIGRGAKLDNLIHVAHNVQIGEDCLLLGQSAVAGSTRLGNRVIIAGQSGLAGHLDVGDDAKIGAASAVFRDVEAGEEVFGIPAGPKAEELRVHFAARRVGELRRRVRDLEKRIAELGGGDR